jgi:biopolymer transport protein ExbD
MGEILQHERSKKAGVHATKKTSLRVDLTPMVDLGFLLISFFVFTTTLAKPTAMNLIMPDDNSKDSSKAPVSKTLNLILGASNRIYAYEGDDINHLENSDNQNTFIRSVILKKEYQLRQHYGSDSDMIVLIKPTNNATYENIINALDEMLISSVKTYVLMDASEKEMKRIEK